MQRRPPTEELSGRSRWRLDAPWASAAFARTTAAAQLALLAASSLGLKHTQRAAMTVWLAAQPTRGLLLDKSILRVVGTLVGAHLTCGGSATTCSYLRDAARILRREHALFER